MFRPKIYAKSSLNAEHMLAKDIIGTDGIELQLLSEMVNSEGDYKNAEDAYDFDLLRRFNIRAVHCPILKAFGMEDVCLESLCTEKHFKLFEQVCYLANRAGEIHKHTVIVIIHSEMTLTDLRMTGLWDNVLKYLKQILDDYPYVEIAIENVTPFRNCSNDQISLANNFLWDNIDMVRLLREQLSTERIGTVLDTCHVEISCKVMNSLKSAFPDIVPDIEYSMNKFFEMNKDVVKLFHFSRTVDNGYGKGKHGQPFDEDSQSTLMNYLELYYKYDYTVPITLEVAEMDYIKSEGYEMSYILMLECLDELERIKV